ncbi:hypothetical protein B0H10DRAFT_2231737 [Mycena sp. CBHHK59/15]|nr:hypothetical protein B0H10DRAFT_2231737 [Mycena sp. CBHHK59/15]
MLISLHLVRASPSLHGDVAPATLVTLNSVGMPIATKDRISAEPRLKSAKEAVWPLCAAPNTLVRETQVRADSFIGSSRSSAAVRWPNASHSDSTEVVRARPTERILLAGQLLCMFPHAQTVACSYCEIEPLHLDDGPARPCAALNPTRPTNTVHPVVVDRLSPLPLPAPSPSHMLKPAPHRPPGHDMSEQEEEEELVEGAGSKEPSSGRALGSMSNLGQPVASRYPFQFSTPPALIKPARSTTELVSSPRRHCTPSRGAARHAEIKQAIERPKSEGSHEAERKDCLRLLLLSAGPSPKPSFTVLQHQRSSNLSQHQHGYSLLHLQRNSHCGLGSGSSSSRSHAVSLSVAVRLCTQSLLQNISAASHLSLELVQRLPANSLMAWLEEDSDARTTNTNMHSRSGSGSDALQNSGKNHTFGHPLRTQWHDAEEQQPQPVPEESESPAHLQPSQSRTSVFSAPSMQQPSEWTASRPRVERLMVDASMLSSYLDISTAPQSFVNHRGHHGLEQADGLELGWHLAYGGPLASLA